MKRIKINYIFVAQKKQIKNLKQKTMKNLFDYWEYFGIGILIIIVIWLNNIYKFTSYKWYHMEIVPEATSNLVIRNLETEVEEMAFYDYEYNRYVLRSGKVIDFDFIWRYDF